MRGDRVGLRSRCVGFGDVAGLDRGDDVRAECEIRASRRRSRRELSSNTSRSADRRRVEAVRRERDRRAAASGTRAAPCGRRSRARARPIPRPLVRPRPHRAGSGRRRGGRGCDCGWASSSTISKRAGEQLLASSALATPGSVDQPGVVARTICSVNASSSVGERDTTASCSVAMHSGSPANCCASASSASSGAAVARHR